MSRTGHGYTLVQVVLWAIVGVDVVAILAALWHARSHQFEGGYGETFIAFLVSPFTVVAILAFMGNLFLLPRMRRFDERLDGAMNGDVSVVRLAAQQPTADPSALSLPTTIELRPRWPNFLIVALVAALMIALAAAVFMFAAQLSIIVSDGLSIRDAESLAALLGFGFGVFGLGFGLTSGRETLVLTEAGLSVSRRHGLTQTIRWADARAFVMAKGNGGKLNPKVIVYMLGTPGAWVAWPYIRRMAWDVEREPTVSLDEYHRQMEALLSLIAARTGLPLFDLR